MPNVKLYGSVGRVCTTSSPGETIKEDFVVAMNTGTFREARIPAHCTEHRCSVRLEKSFCQRRKKCVPACECVCVFVATLPGCIVRKTTCFLSVFDFICVAYEAHLTLLTSSRIKYTEGRDTGHAHSSSKSLPSALHKKPILVRLTFGAR